jgi:outer membrane protein assembly factor BamB
VIYALSADGAQLWRRDIDDLYGRRVPAINPDGTIYVGTLNYELMAIAPDGQVKWRSAPEGTRGGLPLFSEGHIIIIHSEDGRVIAYNTDGITDWVYTTTMKYGLHSTVVGPDGTIYIVAIDDLDPNPASIFVPKLLAVDPAGKLKWSASIDGFSSFCVLPDNRVCVIDPFDADRDAGGIVNIFGYYKYVQFTHHGLSKLSLIDANGNAKRIGMVPVMLTRAPPEALPDGKLLLLGEDGVMHCYQP